MSVVNISKFAKVIISYGATVYSHAPVTRMCEG